jgi:hypothetical protein
MTKKNFLSMFLVLFMIFIISDHILGQQNSNIKKKDDLPERPRLIQRDLLIRDVRQLAEIIESTHPDPYSAGGGKIKFNFRLQKLLQSIPEKGMTKDEFLQLLRPFVAAVGDQHTEIYTDYPVNNSEPGGLPCVFGVVEKSLYIQIPFREEDQKYYGSLLQSVEGVSVPELVERFKKLEGCENDYFALRSLSRGNLLFEPYLSELIPEWKDKTKVTFTLKRPSGKIETISENLPIELKLPLHHVKSKIELPETDDSGFLYSFIDPLKTGDQIAYLRVDHMQGFREIKEVQNALGVKNFSKEELQSFSSATETFRNLVIDMKNKNTQTLIIDIRNNGGGSSRLSTILVYFLYGKEMVLSIPVEVAKSGGGHGNKLSPLYFKHYPKKTLEEINDNKSIPLQIGDIDFGYYLNGNSTKLDSIRLEKYKSSPTFYQEYKNGEYSNYYCPKNVIVLMTPWTSSSGLDMAHDLYRAGAVLLGTPSAQAPNSWGDLLEWQLNYSGINGEVASAFDIEFGDDPERGRVLPVHYPLTYEKLKSFDFDINSEVLYALELLQDLKK